MTYGIEDNDQTLVVYLREKDDSEEIKECKTCVL